MHSAMMQSAEHKTLPKLVRQSAEQQSLPIANPAVGCSEGDALATTTQSGNCSNVGKSTFKSLEHPNLAATSQTDEYTKVSTILLQLARRLSLPTDLCLGALDSPQYQSVVISCLTSHFFK